MTSRLIAIATTAVATVAVLASASLAFAGNAGHEVALTRVAAPAVTVVQLERVVITGKRLPQGQ